MTSNAVNTSTWLDDLKGFSPITDPERDWARRLHAKHPGLTSYGFSVPRLCSDNWADGLSGEEVDGIVMAYRWLSGIQKLKRVNVTDIGSYNAKRYVEDWASFYVQPKARVSEGALILAAIGSGVLVRRRSLNVHGANLGLCHRHVRRRCWETDVRRKNPNAGNLVMFNWAALHPDPNMR